MERGGLHLYSFVSNKPSDLVDPYGLLSWLSVTHSSSTYFGNCGEFDWADVWQLISPGSLGNSGTIIQNMSMEIKIWDCSAPNNDVTDEYFGGPVNEQYAETWSLGNTDHFHIDSPGCSDIARHPCGTKGTGTWLGVAQYYDSYGASDVGDPWGLSWSYGTPSNPQPWGTGGMTMGMNGWVNSSSLPTGIGPATLGYKRKLIINWNCCGGANTTTYSYLAITTSALTP